MKPLLIWIGGLAFPIVVLTGLLIYGLTTTARVAEAPRPGEMRVRVTGEMWWWRVAYLDDQGREILQDANEVHIPAGQPVVFELESADVIHSFWVPRLGGKTDMIPGRRNFMRLQAELHAGIGQIAEAETLYREILAARPIPWASLGLARMLVVKKSWVEAEHILTELLARHHRFIEA